MRSRLFFESFSLIDRVGELRKRVGQLSADDEEFETFGDAFFVSMRFRKRRDLDRVIENERWLA